MPIAAEQSPVAGLRALVVLLCGAQALGCTGAFGPGEPAPPFAVLPPSPEAAPSRTPRKHPFDLASIPPASGSAGAHAPAAPGAPSAGQFAPSAPIGGIAGSGVPAPPHGTGGMFAPPPPPDDGIVFTEAEIALYSTLSPLPPAPPPDPTNAVADDPLAAQLGRALFEDPAFSGPLTIDSELGVVGHEGKVSCATCHFGPALDDFAPFSTGTGVGTRNSLSLVNSAYQLWTNWGGRFSAQWELAIAVVENRAIMNGSRLRVAHRIAAAHRPTYVAVFGPMPPELSDPARFPLDAKPKPAPTPEVPEPPDGAWETMDPMDRATVNRILVNYGKAIAAFLRTIVSRDAPFDRFVAGDRAALDVTAQQGLRLFIGKARCINCHYGPLLSDQAFHNVAVPATTVDDGRHKDIPPLLASPFNSATSWSDAPDSGRLAGLTAPPPEETRGQFRTPSLRGVAQSAPYMHNGWFGDLRSVVEHYSWGNGEPASGTRDRQIVPLHLTEEEIEQLVAFLHSLTGVPVDPSLAVGTRPTW